MTEERPDPHLDELAAQPMDDADAALLGELSRLLTDVDPVPGQLVDRIRFSLALDELYAEVAEVTRMPADALAVRNDPVAGERTETLDVLGRAAHRDGHRDPDRRRAPDGRLDRSGRAAPGPSPMQDEQREVEADETGRFVVDPLPDGFAQLSFHRLLPDGTADDSAVVVTPLFQL